MGVMTLQRSGEFTCKFGPGNLCGSGKQSKFHYTFRVQNAPLDSRGFVIEHVEVNAKIQTWAKTTKFAGSCEQLLDTIAHLIADEYQANGSPWFVVSLTRPGGATLELGRYIGTFRKEAPLWHQPAAKRRSHGVIVTLN